MRTHRHHRVCDAFYDVFKSIRDCVVQREKGELGHDKKGNRKKIIPDLVIIYKLMERTLGIEATHCGGVSTRINKDERKLGVDVYVVDEDAFSWNNVTDPVEIVAQAEKEKDKIYYNFPREHNYSVAGVAISTRGTFSPGAEGLLNTVHEMTKHLRHPISVSYLKAKIMCIIWKSSTAMKQLYTREVCMRLRKNYQVTLEQEM
jgi:hypothetical protein